jgi:gliding motility-associated lipoprotein GldH
MYRLFIILIFFAASCNTLDVFEKTKSFSKHEWESNDAPTFQFQIKDTNALYNLYFVIRHEDKYHYKNIWMNIKVQEPDSVYNIKREFILADNNKWIGSGMDDVYEQRILFNGLPTKLKKGMYNFTLQQIMREDPLQAVLSAGIRVEKVK